MEWWDNYKATAQYYAENASMGEIMGDVLAIALGGILVAAMLPTALDSFYDTNVGWFVYGGTSTGTNYDWVTDHKCKRYCYGRDLQASAPVRGSGWPDAYPGTGPEKGPVR